LFSQILWCYSDETLSKVQQTVIQYEMYVGIFVVCCFWHIMAHSIVTVTYSHRTVTYCYSSEGVNLISYHSLSSHTSISLYITYSYTGRTSN